jgi:hypothetical protein
MKKSFLFFSFRFLLISVIALWAVCTKAQVNSFAIGGGIGYCITPYLYSEYKSFSLNGLHDNITPSVTLRYGNKISGVFKASYIQNTFGQFIVGQHGSYEDTHIATIHQVYGDLLFEHNPKGSRGFFYYLGPGFGIPVKVKMTEDDDEYAMPAEFDLSVQGVIGLGGYIPVKEKNLINIEFNVRIGLNKVLVNMDVEEEARMIAFQLILGYLRRL